MATQELPQTPLPKRQIAETEQLIGEELFLLDDRRGVVHCLNSGAALVWFLCDGQRDIEGMATEIANTFSLVKKQVMVDVRQAVAQFQALGLLEPQVAGTQTTGSR